MGGRLNKIKDCKLRSKKEKFPSLESKNTLFEKLWLLDCAIKTKILFKVREERLKEGIFINWTTVKYVGKRRPMEF